MAGKARRKVLYHGTSIECLAGILLDDRINPCVPDEYDRAHDGASLTTALAVARKFADEAKERGYDRFWDSPVEDGVILVFDRDAVVSGVGGQKVLWDGCDTEREFRTFGAMHRVMKYLVQVRLDESALPWWINALEEAGEPEKAAALRNIPADLLTKRGRERPAVPVDAPSEHVSRYPLEKPERVSVGDLFTGNYAFDTPEYQVLEVRESSDGPIAVMCVREAIGTERQGDATIERSWEKLAGREYLYYGTEPLPGHGNDGYTLGVPSP